MKVFFERDKCKLIFPNKERKVYQDFDGNDVEYELSEILFKNFKRKKKTKNNTLTDTSTEELICKEFLTTCKLQNLFPSYDDTEIERYKEENIKRINTFYDLSDEIKDFRGENNLDYGKITSIGKCEFLIPPKCRFFNKRIEEISSFLPTTEKFDLIVMDPPWRSRYIKRLKKNCRKKSYNFMENHEIKNIPLEDYIHEASILAIWCTNSHNYTITNEILDKWNLKLFSIWKWVKIDACGDLFNSFDENKKPYEKIFIAVHRENNFLESRLEKDLNIFCQPSSIHSHKPALLGEKI